MENKVSTINPNQFSEDLIKQGDSGDLVAVEEQLREHLQKLAVEAKKEESVQL